jgi:replicative DNA helicase
MSKPTPVDHAEEAVLGAMMLDREVVWKVTDILRGEDFAQGGHQRIFDAIVKTETEKSTTDVVVVAEHLHSQGLLDSIGGLAYLGGLVRNTPTSSNAEHYAKVVKARSAESALRKTGHTLIQIADGVGPDVSDKIDEAQQLVMSLTTTSRKAGPSVLGLGLREWLDELDARQQRGGGLAGIPTGLTDLDRSTAGFEPGDLIIVAGRPSMGKTSLAMNIAQYTAQRRGAPAVFFSMEMRRTELVSRCVASESGVDLQMLRAADLTGEGWRKVTEATTAIQDIPLFVDDSPALTLMEVRSRARNVKQRNGLSLIVVDYLQLMTGEGENRTNEVSAISRGLKSLAKELEVPVIALSQLNRDLERRNNKRPMLSDLRESGSIEQDADVIVFVYRERVYNPNTNFPDVAELIIGKQRNGPTGTVVTMYHAPTCTFRSADHDYQRQYTNAMSAQRADSGTFTP